MKLWDGSCMVHEVFSRKRMLELKTRHPEAMIIAHPECQEDVLAHADFIGSTTALLKYVKASDHTSFIVMTEAGILHQMRKENPGKSLIAGPSEGSCACNDCPHMKLNTLEKLYLSLRYEAPELNLSPALMQSALKPIQRMLEISESLSA